MAEWGSFPPLKVENSSGLPLYVQLAQALEGLIREGTVSPQTKLPSENELEELVGLSRSTIRKSLEDLEQKGLVYRKQGQGTFVAPNPPTIPLPGVMSVSPRLNTGASSTKGIIGLLLPTMLNEIYPQIVQGVEGVAKSMGYSVFIGNTYADRDKEYSLLQQMTEIGAAGLILEPTNAKFDQPGTRTFQLLKNYPLPFVLVGNQISGIQASEVLIDDFRGGYTAAEHLLRRGHRRIAYLYKESVLPAIDRREGLLAALRDAGLPENPELIMAYHEEEEHLNPGYTFTQKLLSSKTVPDAIFYFNDDLAFNGMRAIRDAGLSIPKDISVIGFDNVNSADLPGNRLSSVDHPKSLCGRWAADILFDQLARGPNRIRRRIMIQPELVERDTVRSR